jgi:hypothetical protein
MLPDRPGLIKVNVAIANHDGYTKIFYVKKEDVILYGLPEWVCGCNSIESPHTTVENLLKSKNLQHLVQVKEVETMSPETLIKKYLIDQLDLLKIDVEGKDGMVLNSWIDACENLSIELPKKIFLEDNGLDKTDATKNSINRLIEIGYTSSRLGGDVTLQK